ncbi:spermidine/putrescine ABC transporter ATP-binding protein [Cellulosilyticum sp. I15G10I2]|uniref:spermidine/putrescine ABC transporter ATP-binding protein n=1 Tax=Cellulosilyticum sp. I15G10I2 TaxID=1892843 RepID=UPI00085C89D9|nr:spermidine/putrescine ABC transporter ATP-binding protein [Cellulosilyticum sp. I15G10I2]
MNAKETYKDYIIDLKNISKSFDHTEVLKDISMYIRRNEFVTLLGPSGCGKTTLLRIIGGFEEPSQGDVFFEGKNIVTLPPYKRKINTVFQKYALFPHMNVEDNIAFGLNIKKLDKQLIKKKVDEILELVNLKGFQKRSIDSLSGGQQQRIAIARALVNEPDVLLLDEPLGALDLKLRKGMQLELKKIQQKIGITFIYVTHDQEEALTMSDTIAIMHEGKVQQIGTPVDIYNEPKNAFVADFIGESNILEGIMLKDYQVQFHNYVFECVDAGFGENTPVDVVVRPEDIQIVSKEQGMLSGCVESVTFKGVHYEMLIKGEKFLWMVHSTTMSQVGETVGLIIIPADIHIMKRSTVYA